MGCGHHPVDMDASPALKACDSPQSPGELSASLVDGSKSLQLVPEVSVSVDAQGKRFGSFHKDPSC
ncbi:MAG: hypothetical protein ACRDMH_10395 [Solirubrobacterales bacterium]